MRDVDEVEAKLAERRDADHSYKNSGQIDALEWALEPPSLREVEEIEDRLAELRDADHSFKNDGKREALEWVLEQRETDEF